MITALETYLEVANIGGRLGMAGDKLRMLLPSDCSPELKDAIRQYKAALIQLLRLDFWIVHSDTLNVVVFWTPDEATKESLVVAGADPGSIYTAAELDILKHRHITVDELPLIHAAKQRFGGKLERPITRSQRRVQKLFLEGRLAVGCLSVLRSRFA